MISALDARSRAVEGRRISSVLSLALASALDPGSSSSWPGVRLNVQQRFHQTTYTATLAGLNQGTYLSQVLLSPYDWLLLDSYL